MRPIKPLLALVWLALAAGCSTGSLLAANTASMPKAAPDFRKSSASKLAAAKASEAKLLQQQNQPYDGTTFRVQTKATPVLQGNLDHISIQPPLLQGAADTVIKTNPQRAEASSVPPEMFRAWLEQAHPKFALHASAAAPTSILEVKGVYDNSSKTLRSLGIPFEQVRGADLETMLPGNTKVVVVNCPGRVPRQSFQQLRDWVSAGGYVLSTDWSSDNLVEQAFPGYIRWDRHSNRQAIYDAEVVRPDQSLYARTVTNSSWKMDIDSHMIKILRPDVRVLARSRQLQSEDPAGDGVLAVVFPFGRGYVLHLVGHFDNNTMMSFRNMLADPAPQIGISLRQAIAANFVVAGLEGTRIPIK